jgi:nucleotide-binding universal stress UspA family protein
MWLDGVAAGMYEHILLATDGSDRALTATEHAVALATRFDATLHVLFVIETRTAYDTAIIDREEARANLRAVGEDAIADVENLTADTDLSVVTAIEEGVPAEQIVTYVDAHGIDLVVLGERGHSEFTTVLLGSTAETVLSELDIPVTVV